MKLKKFLNWRAWLGGLWTSFVQGGCAAILGSTGLVGANLVGVDVAPMDVKQTVAMFMSAATVRMLFFLNSHPLPDEVEEQDTEPTSTPTASNS